MFFRFIISIFSCALLSYFSLLESSAHSGGLNNCGSHFEHKNGTCHRHRGTGAAQCPCFKSSNNEFNKSASAPLPQNIFGKPGRVIDGDTLYVGDIRVRLHGIDSPELEQTCRHDRPPLSLASSSPTIDSASSEIFLWRCGEESSEALRSLLSGTNLLFCRVIDRDRWSRVIGICFRTSYETDGYLEASKLPMIELEDRDLGELLVSLGLSMDYAYYSGGRYRLVEDTARLSRLGIWRGCFTEPRAWRRGTRSCGE